MRIAMAELSSVWPLICDVYSMRPLARWSLLSVFELKQNKLNDLSILSFWLKGILINLLSFLFLKPMNLILELFGY